MKIDYRPDIDGLRAIAVLLVIFYHAEISYNSNVLFQFGFIGVDIFFVISGYLITCLILKELKDTQKFSFLNFYERRVRRLLPALFFVMIFSMPLAWFYLLPNSFLDYSKSIIYSIFFTSNFYFHFTGLEYGAPDSLLKPFLHTWSLAVEEQFYIIFPIFLIIFYKYFKKNILKIIIFIFFISLLFTEYGARNNPSANFYFLHSRIWELLAGSFLAYYKIFGVKKNKNQFINNFGSLFGLILIILYFFLYNKNSLHPSLLTLFPVIGTCCIIWFSNQKNWLTLILSSKPFVGVGLISYSLYLWHYPIFAIARVKDSTPSEYDKFEWIALTFVLSLITYFLVEKFFKNRLAFSKRRLFISLSALLLIIILSNSYIINKEGFKYKLQITDSYSLDNEAHKDEWINFVKKIGMPEFSQIKNKKVLIVGNSHANDTFNLFYMNKDLFKSYDFSIINVHVACFYEFLNRKFENDMSLYCRQVFADKDYPQAEKLFLKSELIILSTKWFEKDVEKLDLLIKQLKKESKKILLLNSSLEVKTKIRRGFHILDFFVLNNGRLPFDNELKQIEEQTYKQLKNTKKIDITLKKIAKENNIEILFKEKYLCDSNKKTCKVLTNNNKKISWDYAHYTLDGAKYLGKRIYDLNWFNY